MSIEMYAATDVGMKRDHNEDFVGITPSHGFAVLADGMGGHNAGEVASEMSVDISSGFLKENLTDLPIAEIDPETGFTRESVLAKQAAMMANDVIFNTAKQKKECAGMGTTLVIAIFYGDRLTTAHVGDSRMYRLRNETLTHVTEDHSLIQEQVRRGLLTAEEARNSNIKNLVTRALGVEEGVEPDVVEDIVQAGDMYLLCSDGLTDVLPDEAVRLTMVEHIHDMEKLASELIQMANDAGGPDNISVILVRTEKNFQRKKGLFSRLFSRND